MKKKSKKGDTIKPFYNDHPQKGLKICGRCEQVVVVHSQLYVIKTEIGTPKWVVIFVQV